MEAIALTLVRDTPQLVDAMRTMLPDVRVVDNGSAVQVEAAWMRIPRNRYFSGGWNRAMERLYVEGYRGYAWMLNSDVSHVSPGMLRWLADAAIDHRACVISPAVPTSVWPEMKLPCLRVVKLVDWVAPLVDVRWFVESGGLDEQFPGWGSDIDICYRTQQDKKIVLGDTAISHPYGTTSRAVKDKTMYDIDMTRACLIRKHGLSIRNFAPGYMGRCTGIIH